MIKFQWLKWYGIDSEQGDDLLTKEQQEEINRRIEKHEKSEGKTFTWDEIQSRLKFRWSTLLSMMMKFKAISKK